MYPSLSRVERCTVLCPALAYPWSNEQPVMMSEMGRYVCKRVGCLLYKCNTSARVLHWCGSFFIPGTFFRETGFYLAVIRDVWSTVGKLQQQAWQVFPKGFSNRSSVGTIQKKAWRPNRTA